MKEDSPAQINNPQILTPPSIPDELIGEPLYGVRGWLLLFCLTMTVIRPLKLIVAFNTSTTPDALWLIAECAFTFCIGIELWRVSRRALGLLKIYFIIFLVLGFLGLFSTFAELGRTGRSLAEPRLSDSFSASAGMILFVAVWWSYFKKSERVRFTFGKNI